MSTHHHGSWKGKGQRTVIGGLLVGSLAMAITWVMWRPGTGTDVAFSDLDGARLLTDAEMKQIQAGWLEPKARKQRCPGCEKCEQSTATGRSSDGSSPSLDTTTAEVSERVDVATVGSRTLTLGLTYSSHLADGTNTIVDTTMGSGWTHSYNSYLLQRGARFFWMRGNTEIAAFTDHGGVYETSTGQFMELTLTGTDTAEVRLTDGTVYAFQQQDVPWEPAGLAFMVQSIVDPNERNTEFEYGPEGHLTKVTDWFLNTMEFEYDTEDRLSRVTASNREALFEYESDTGQLSAVVLPGGARIEYEYNFRAQMTAKTVPNGGTYHIDYNEAGKAYRLRDPNDQTIVTQTSTHDWAPDHALSLASGEMQYVPGTATVTDGRGNQWEYEYDERGRITKNTDPDKNFTTIEYDEATLLPSRIVDANGNPTEYEYDEQGNRTLMRDAEGNETQFEYEPVHNRLTRRIEPDGDEWIFEYDAEGNLTKEIDPLIEQPDDATITYEYYPTGPYQGLLWKQTDRNGNVTEWEYNPDGSTSKIIDPVGCETTFTYDAFGNMLTRTLHNDTGDQTTTFTYDARDRVVTETDPEGHTTKTDYDANGNRLAVFTCWLDDSNYRSVTRYEYDGRDRLTTTIEDEGGDPENINRTTQYEYDGNDNRTEEIDPNGVFTESHYDALNRLERTVRDPGGLEIEWQYAYDAVRNRTARTDPNGHTTTFEYDALNRRRFVTDPLGNVTEYRYSAPGGGGGGGGCPCGTPGSSLVSCIIDAEGKVTQYDYDVLDRRITEIRQVGTQDCDADPDGDEAVTAYTYDPAGNLLTTTDPNGNVITNTYTARDEVESVSNGCAETTEYVYDCAGNRIEERPPNGNVIQYEYDLNNRLVRVHDTLGDVAEYTYDCVGNRVTAGDAVSPPGVFEYDNVNRPMTMIDPLGESTHYEYDAVGNQTKIIDREGNEKVYEYDNARRLLLSTIWAGAPNDPIPVSYAYDATGNLSVITDANGNTTAYEYDAVNRRITETYADGTQRRFAYDGVGNLTTREDNMGQDDEPGNITTYTYDDLHRLTMRDYATGDGDVFTHDKGGRMLSADNNHSHVGYTYDCADRVLTSTQTDLPQIYSYTVTYAYDVYGNSRTITYPSGKVVVETRDLRNRLETVSADGEDVATYAYDLANRVETKTFANGTEARYAYNDNDWVTDLRHVATDGTTTFAGFAHTYDTEGNRLNAENLQQVIPYDDAKPVTHSEKYEYDDAYRLIDYQRGQWVGGDIPAPRRDRTWTLDPVHNWTEFGIQDLDTGEDADYCNSVNQMNEYDDPSNDGPPPIPDDDGLSDDFMVTPCPLGSHSGDLDGDGDVDLADFGSFQLCFAGSDQPPAAACPAGTDADYDSDGDVDLADLAAFNGAFTGPLPPPALPTTGLNRAHDKNGNLVDDGEREYLYDYQTTMTSSLRAENRLTMVNEKGTGEILGQYWYDALARRIRKLIPGTPDVSTVHVYTYEGRAIEEYESRTLARRYAYGAWIDEILALDRALEGDRLYCHANAVGSIIALSDDGGAPGERYTYDPYGLVSFFDSSGMVMPQSAIGNPYLFAGRRFDPETGWYYYRTRYLDPVGGRFSTSDSIGNWGDGDNLGNAYTYVRSNPMAFVDPWGLREFYLYTGEKWKYFVDVWLRDEWWDTTIGLTRNVAEIDARKCCSLHFNGFTDYSNPDYEQKYSGRISTVQLSFTTLASAAKSTGACTCKGKRVDGLSLKVYHLFRTEDTVTYTFTAGVEIEAGAEGVAKVTGKLGATVTIPPASQQSTVVYKILVCPTGDDNSRPSATLESRVPNLSQRHGIVDHFGPYWANLQDWVPRNWGPESYRNR